MTLTLRIEHWHEGAWHEVHGHACTTDEEAMAYAYRFGMPRPPTMAELRSWNLGDACDEAFGSAAARWRDEWAKGPTMRVVPSGEHFQGERP